MSAVVECPGCHESLELPDEFLDGVECPHCAAAFMLKPVLLSDAAAENAGSAPGEQDPKPAADESAAPATAPSKEPGEEPAGEAENKAASSSGMLFAALAGERDRGGSADKPAGAPPNSAAEEGVGKRGEDKEAEGKVPADKKDKSDKTAAKGDAQWAGLDTSSSSTASSSEEGSASSSAGSMSAKAARHRQKQGPSLWTQAIGIFGGGALGLYLGYWGLNFFGGPQFYFVELPLPFVQHASGRTERPESEFPAPPPGGGPITIESPRRQPTRPPRNRPNNSSYQQPAPSGEAEEGLAAPSQPPPEPVSSIPSYSSQDLADALTEADRATSASTNPEGNVTPAVFKPLCHLAEVVTFVGVNEPQVLARRQAVDTVMRRVTQRENQLADINHQAETLLQMATAPTQGIVLVGQVIDSSTAGPWHLLRVQLLATVEMRSITLVSNGRIPLQPGAARLFLGSVLPQPRQTLEEYPLDEAPVVWAGMWVALAADAS